MPRFSVVIPLHNKGAYIKHTLNSVISQTFQNFEIIIIDDGSTDNGAEIVKNFKDPRIRLIQQKNEGVSAARNRGIDEAHGELIAFLDADDEWMPTFLETILRLREGYSEAGAYATAYTKRFPNGHEKNLKFYNLLNGQIEGLLISYFRSATRGEFPIRSSNVAIPKTVFCNVGKFSLGERWGEDTDMWGRIALRYPIAYSMNVCMIYNIDTLNSADKTIIDIQEHPFIKNARIALKNSEIDKRYVEDLKEYIDRELLATAEMNFLYGNIKLARNNLSKCFSKYFRNRKRFMIIKSYLPQKIIILINKLIYKIYSNL